MSPQTVIIRYLDHARIMQLATASNGKPWCASLFFAHDNEHNLYWISQADTRHSKEIEQNSHVAGAIVLPQSYGDAVHGLQFEGTARMVAEPDEIRSLAQAYAERYNMGNLAESILSGANKYKLYQIKPTQFILFDVSTFPEEPRQVWHLSETSYNKSKDKPEQQDE
ncbi:MAG TPA: pyridoxamine 5'-phosphate oxidase family protein [Candidatus Saccharimonadales bacterium]|nr:pyridoxamine 5'-phosphate oxidase family protein [Candidatus Saccharimonadales bacterium]